MVSEDEFWVGKKKKWKGFVVQKMKLHRNIRG